MIQNNNLPGSPRLRRLRRNRGQTLVEYALILAFISVVAISVLIAMGNEATSTYTTIDHQLASAESGGDASSAPARGH